MPANAKVIKKLKAHPDHKTKPAGKLEQLAIELTSPEKIRERFTHLLEHGYRLAENIVEEDDRDLLHTLELEEHHQRVKHDTSKACHLPVKLSLQKLQVTPPFANSFAKKLKFEYGALHSAIIVGNVVVEWGREELIEPRIIPNFMAEFVANVGDQGEWHEKEGQYQALMSLANGQGDREQKLDIIIEATDEKAQLIDKLVEVIVEYNSNKEYSVFSCNCQDFAREALAALGIKKPVEFKGLLKQRFEALKAGNRKVPDQLQSHENLDMYVEGVKGELELQDLEYLQCLYFSEHLPKMEKSEDPDNWKCNVRGCKSTELDRLIELHSNPHKRLLNKPAPSRQAPLQLSYSSPSQGLFLATAGPNPHPSQAISGQQTESLPPNLLRGTTSEVPISSAYNTQSYPTHCNESGIMRASTAPTIANNQIRESHAIGYSNIPQAKEERKKCPTAGCEFYGTKETSFYCSECFKANNGPKCDNCYEFFGNPEFNGLCYNCLLKKTSLDPHMSPANSPAMRATRNIHSGATTPPTSRNQIQSAQNQIKCYECNSFFASEEYHGLCHSCFMLKTKIESEGFTQQENPSVLSKPSQPLLKPHYTPGYEKCQSPNCNNPKTETGYC